MKLVEILARELNEWPFAEHLPLTQAYDGSIFVSSADIGEGEGTLRTGITLTIAEDIASDEPVTRAQWEAERARILLESQRQRDLAIQEITSSVSVGYQLERDHESEEVKRYEQELWDKAAVAATQAFITGHITHFGHENVWQDTELVSCAADYADAFMAERAKRLKGGA